jgi:mxaL protein
VIGKFARVQFALLIAALIGFAVAVVGLRVPRVEQRINAVVAFDITQSMNVEDVRLEARNISRIALAREAIRRTVAALPCGSKIGYGVFTEYRTLILFLPIEVCANRKPLEDALKLINYKMAWSGNSEVAKAYFSGLRQLKSEFATRPADAAAALAPTAAEPALQIPALLFITDGHEAPPVNPKLRPRYDGKPGESPALLIGVGGDIPQPIPKFAPNGQPLGVWNADEVAQQDVYSQGRGSSTTDKLVDLGSDELSPATLSAFSRQAGGEHLSSLHADYLRLLAGETGAHYLRLTDAHSLLPQLSAIGLSQPIPVLANWDWIGAALGLLALLLFYSMPLIGPMISRSNFGH